MNTIIQNRFKVDSLFPSHSVTAVSDISFVYPSSISFILELVLIEESRLESMALELLMTQIPSSIIIKTLDSTGLVVRVWDIHDSYCKNVWVSDFDSGKDSPMKMYVKFVGKLSVV